uniref:Uncharacterized protein n=1 Tax=Poecilia formosa TaxID=48698 RepID=A0A087Y7N6_POEFO
MGKKFFVIVEGVETGAQRCLVQMIRDIGQTKVSSPEECDYFLVFCPVVSRVAADISGALARVPANKPGILVVLHHTSDANLALAESSRQVHDLNVILTVDFLFWNDDLLDSSCNNKSWNLIQNHLGCSKNSVKIKNIHKKHQDFHDSLQTEQEVKLFCLCLLINLFYCVIIIIMQTNSMIMT